MSPAIRVSLVCLGNICRSPMAASVLRNRLAEEGLAERVHVSSAGTGGWHVGSAADPRARHALRQRGYDGDSHRAQQFDPGWFDRFELVLAMDQSNLHDLRRMASPEHLDKIALLRSFDEEAAATGDLDVPDPYFGGPEGFDTALDQIERAVDGLVATLRERLDSRHAPR